jgi:hypothetical protein
MHVSRKAAPYAYTCSPLLILPMAAVLYLVKLHAQWCMRMGLPDTNASGLITYYNWSKPLFCRDEEERRGHLPPVDPLLQLEQSDCDNDYRSIVM